MGLASSPRKIEYNRARYRAKRSEILAQQRLYYEKNKDAILARNRARPRNDRTAAERSRRYDERNREKRRLQALERRRNNPGYAYAATKRYYQRHPEAKQHSDAVRYARRKGAGGGHTLDQWQAKKAAYDFLCGYCYLPNLRLYKDHDVPLARGGSDEISNIVPSCLRCNSQKRALTGDEYRERFHGSRG